MRGLRLSKKLGTFAASTIAAVTMMLAAPSANAQTSGTTPDGLGWYLRDDGNPNQIAISGYQGTNANITIPSTINGLPVTAIWPYALHDKAQLNSVVIPSSVKWIRADAFTGCYNITRVTLSYGVTNIDQDAFSHCSGLHDIVIPDSVKYIGARAFGDGCGLRNITIPTSVTTLGPLAFWHDFNFTNICFEGIAPFDGGGSNFDMDPISVVYYQSGTTGWGSTFSGVPTMSCSQCVGVITDPPQTGTVDTPNNLLTDVNGNPPQSGAHDYVIVIRGFKPLWETDPYAPDTAMSRLGTAIQNRVGNNSSVLICRWSQNSGNFPIDAVRNARAVGHNVVNRLLTLGSCDSVQAVGHSAGTWVANDVAQEFNGMGKRVNLTLLDAYVPGGLYNQIALGAGVDNTEQYYETKSYPGVGIVLDNAANYDVTRVGELVEGKNLSNWAQWHDWPVNWYNYTVQDSSWYSGYGVGYQDRFNITGSRGEPPNILPPPQAQATPMRLQAIDQTSSFDQPGLFLSTGLEFTNLNVVAHGGSGTVSTNNGGVQLSTTNFVWATFGVNSTNDFNYATLNYSLSTNCNSIVGMWMDGQPMMMLQSSPQDDTNDVERFPLSGALGSGNHNLTVSLQSLDGIPLSATMNEINFDLAVLAPAITSQSVSNGQFSTSWEAAAGLKYQAQKNDNLSSTNWSNLGGLLTSPTNAVMSAFDAIGTNSQRFYRVQMVQ